MQKQRPTYNHPPMFEKSTSGAQKATVCCLERTKKTPSGSTAIKLPKIEKKLNPIPLSLLISLRPKTLKNVTKADKETVQLLELISLR